LLLGGLLVCSQGAAIPANAPPSSSSAEAKPNASGDKSDFTSKLSRLEELTRKLAEEQKSLLKEIVSSDGPRIGLQRASRKLKAILDDSFRTNQVPSELNLFKNDLADRRKVIEELPGPERAELSNALTSLEQRSDAILNAHSAALSALNSTKQSFENWARLGDVTARLMGENDADATVRKLAAKEGAKVGTNLMPTPTQVPANIKPETQQAGVAVQSPRLEKVATNTEPPLNQKSAVKPDDKLRVSIGTNSLPDANALDNSPLKTVTPFVSKRISPPAQLESFIRQHFDKEEVRDLDSLMRDYYLIVELEDARRLHVSVLTAERETYFKLWNRCSRFKVQSQQYFTESPDSYRVNLILNFRVESDERAEFLEGSAERIYYVRMLDDRWVITKELETMTNRVKGQLERGKITNVKRAASVRDLESLAGLDVRGVKLSGRFVILSWGPGTVVLAPEPGAASPGMQVEVQVRCSGKVHILNLQSGRWQGANIGDSVCLDLGLVPLDINVISVKGLATRVLEVSCSLDGDAIWPNLPKLKTVRQ